MANVLKYVIFFTASACSSDRTQDSAGTTADASSAATTSASDLGTTTHATTGAPTTTAGASSTATGDGTSTTEGESGGSLDSSGSSEGESDSPSCEAYCTTIRANCAILKLGTQQFNHGLENCLANCRHLPTGSSTDLVGNTLGCRLNQAKFAADEWPLHCVEAGPGGAGTCGDNCEGYCTLALGNCPDAYPDMAGCMTACAAIPDDVDYNITVIVGDSLACRLKYLVLAAQSPDLCPYIGIESAPCSP